MANRISDLNLSTFDDKVSEFLVFLYEVVPKLPGPKHPATKYYEKRKKNKLVVHSAQQSRSSNPQRADKRAKLRRREKYQYELAQFQYYHQRKKVARRVMGDTNFVSCPIEINQIKQHFEDIFSE